jgi:hypothetical protein
MDNLWIAKQMPVMFKFRPALTLEHARNKCAATAIDSSY